MWCGWIRIMLAPCGREEGAEDAFGGAIEGGDTVVFGGGIASSFVAGREDGGGV
jgi:hypothetical protein